MRENIKSKINKLQAKPILGGIVFVVAFIITLTALTYMVRPEGDTKNRFMGFYAEPEDSIDVILIGSSPTYSSVVMPQLYGEFGIRSFPLASNVQRPVAGAYLVREAEKTQDPDLYMFEMRMYTGTEESFTMNMGYTREVTDNMKYSFNRIATINAMVTDEANSSDNLRYTYYFDIFKYHTNWISLVNGSQWRSFDFTVLDPYKGYKITDKVGPAEKTVIPEDISAVPIDPDQEMALMNLLDLMDEMGKPALFYLAPYAETPEEASKFAYIKEIVTSRGYDFLDMNEYTDEIGIDFSCDFSDYGIHTNAAGAQKCTAFVGSYLRSHYDLPDRRDDKLRDTSWDEAYKNWQSEYEEALKTIARRVEEEDYFVME